MKVLTLHQPWASLVALGVKTIETRSWSTQYRGPLAIHAGLQGELGDVGPYQLGVKEGRLWLMCPDGYARQIPLGAIVATCTLVDVVPIYGPFGESDVDISVRVGGPWGADDSPGRATIQGPSAADLRRVTDQLPYGDFTPGRYAWLLADVVPVDPPVPFKGGQGLTKTWEAVARSHPEA